jgi:hypothetical protein
VAEPDDPGGDDGAAITAHLFSVLDSGRAEVGIADLRHYGTTIEIELVNGDYWAIECIGADAFHFYPGAVSDDAVNWLNVWVGPDLTFEEMTGRLAEVAAKAKRRTE